MDIQVDTTGRYGPVIDWNICYLFEVKVYVILDSKPFENKEFFLAILAQ